MKYLRRAGDILATVIVLLLVFVPSLPAWLVLLTVVGVWLILINTVEWLTDVFHQARRSKADRRETKRINARCGLRSDALTVEEALALSEDDIHAVAWTTQEAGRGSAENLAHVLADRKSREHLSDGLPRLYQETAKAEAKLRAQVTLVTKRAMVAKAVKILLQK